MADGFTWRTGLARWAPRVGVALAVLAVGWWLFADTARHHAGSGGPAGALRVSFWGGYEDYRMWEELRDGFVRRFPEVPVKLEYLPDRYESKLQQLLVADSAPDVMLFQDEPMPAFARSGKFADLKARVADEPGMAPETFWPTSFRAFEAAGPDPDVGGAGSGLFGVPIFGGCNLVFYHRPSFAAAKIRLAALPGPEGLLREGDGWVLDEQRWSIDEFVRVAELLSGDDDGDGRVDRFGFALPQEMYWLPWHWSLGASVLDETRTRLTYYGEACERSLQLYQDLRYRYRVSPTPAELGTAGSGVGFLTGRVAMQSNGPWNLPFVNAAGVDFGVLHIPRGPGGHRATRVTWDALAMSSRSRRPDDAWAFIRYVADPEGGQRIIAKYQRSFPARRAAAATFTSGGNSEAAAKFIAVVGAYAEDQPISPHWEQMRRAWTRSMESLQHPVRRLRATPAQAIGELLSDERLTAVLPPLDEREAERYRAIYRAWKGGAGEP